jgi:hypothetical protein
MTDDATEDASEDVSTDGNHAVDPASHGSSTWKVLGAIDAPDGTGVLGHNTAASGQGSGVTGVVDSPEDAAGVLGRAPAGEADAVIGIAENGGIGVGGSTDATDQSGMLALNTATAGEAIAHHAQTSSSGDGSAGVLGEATAGSGQIYGVRGTTNSPGGYGLATPDDATVGGSLSIGAIGATAEQTTDITIGGTPTDVVYDSEVVDDRDEYDPSTGEFTCAHDGSYHVKSQVFWEGGLTDGEGIRLSIRLQGFAEAVDSVNWSNGGSRRTQSVTTVLRNVSAGDTIKITAQTGGSDHDIVGITNRANLQISQIG